MVVKPRLRRWEDQEAFDPHNTPMVVLGTLILWFGWYGFNGASTLAMKSSGDAFTSALVSINTTLAPCIAGMTLFLLRWKVLPPRRKDVCGLCNGILAGLVSITAGCGTVAPWEALIIGFFGSEEETGGNGLFYGGNQLGIQLVGAICIIVWVAALSFPILFGLKVAGLLRVDPATEEEGLDAVEHSPQRGYSPKAEGNSHLSPRAEGRT